MSRRSRRRFERIHTKRAKAGFPHVSPAILHKDGTIEPRRDWASDLHFKSYQTINETRRLHGLPVVTSPFQPEKVIEFAQSYCGNNPRWVKSQSWKWWSTPLYYLLLPLFMVRAFIYYLRAPRDEWRTWENFVGVAKGMCDARTGRLYKWL